MLTNVKLAQPTVLIMRTVRTQRAHIIVVVKLDLQEMEPIAPVRTVTEHPLFTAFKKRGRYEKRRTLVFWSKFTDYRVSNYWVFSTLLKSIYNFFADNFYNCLLLIDGNRRLSRLVINSDLTHIGIVILSFLTFLFVYSLFTPDIDECAVESSECDVNAECVNVPGSFNCTCKAGFTGNGTMCKGL